MAVRIKEQVKVDASPFANMTEEEFQAWLTGDDTWSIESNEVAEAGEPYNHLDDYLLLF